LLGHWSAYNVLCLIRVYGKYIFAETIHDDQVRDMWFSFVTLLERICRRSFTINSINELRELTFATMAKFDGFVPATERTMILHIVLHIHEHISNWGPVRTYWAFPFERFTGTLKSMIQLKVDIEAHLMEIARNVMCLIDENEINLHDELSDEFRFISTIPFPTKSDCTIPLEHKHVYHLLRNITNDFAQIEAEFEQAKNKAKARHKKVGTFEEWLQKTNYNGIPKRVGKYICITYVLRMYFICIYISLLFVVCYA
jgi:hypothetical protein